MVMMVMTRQRKIMGKFIIDGWLSWLGWASALAMIGCVAGMLITWIV
jgi:Mn2+/Fe2+ NRAMP family transporter